MDKWLIVSVISCYVFNGFKGQKIAKYFVRSWQKLPIQPIWPTMANCHFELCTRQNNYGECSAGITTWRCLSKTPSFSYINYYSFNSHNSLPIVFVWICEHGWVLLLIHTQLCYRNTLLLSTYIIYDYTYITYQLPAKC